MGVATTGDHHYYYSKEGGGAGQSQTKNPMSQQDYHHHQAAAGIFSFSNAFDRSQTEQQQQQQQQHNHHIAQQIRRDKLRGGFEPPPPLITIDEVVEPTGIPGYEAAGMLSEMFNFNSHPGGGHGGADISSLENQLVYRGGGNTRAQQQPPPPTTPVGSEWYGNRQGIMLAESKDPNVILNHDRDAIPTHHHQQQQQISGINADSAAAMQLFLMNPQPARSPSPTTQSHPPPPTSSTLHMLLPNPPHHHHFLQHHHHQVNPTSPAGGHFGPSHFTWVPDHTTPSDEIGGGSGVVEGQGLSLSLSSSLQHLEAATTSAAAAAAAAQYPYKSLSGMGQNHQVHIGFGSSLGMVNVLRSSKYAKAAQELLEEFCSVGRGHLKKNNKLARNNSNPNSNPSGSGGGGGGGATSGGGGANSASSSKDLPPLSAADRLEHQRRKVKLLAMLDEVDRRYNHYCEQMQMVVNSFDLVMGFGAAVPYTALAQKAMSRHFRCLKDAIAAQLKSSCELLGEKDAGTSGVTKGETPRLKLLEQSLRQQRAFHQMGMMEQEAWRPQRGLPERSVNILRAWLFEHFLHPYPSDADKHLLARQTGLSRNQVSNWFINARVRLWKPMVEEMYQQEAKDEAEQDTETTNSNNNNNNNNSAQTPMPCSATATTATTTTTPTTAATTATTATGKRSEMNDTENDPSFFAINTQCFSENQAKLHHPHPPMPTSSIPLSSAAATVLAPAGGYDQSDACRRGVMMTTSSGNGDHQMGSSTLIRFGTSAGDVSLTLGLRHAGNLPEKTSTFSVRDFGGC